MKPLHEVESRFEIVYFFLIHPVLSIHPWIEGKPVGQHPLVIRLMKGIANERPLKPRYTTTWDVAKVTTYLSALGEKKTLSLKLLTKKLLMLLALVSPERASVLWELNIRYLKKQPDGVVFTLIKPRKSGDPMSLAKATFPRFLQAVLASNKVNLLRYFT